MILQNISKAIREQNYYAVALEFVIVIAGVVIGFQINAWADARSDAARAEVLRERLFDDFSLITSELARARSRVGENATAALSVRDLLLAGTPPERDEEFERWLFGALSSATAVGGSPTFAEMQSTGSLNLITEDDLRSALVAYEQQAAQTQSVEDFHLPAFMDALAELDEFAVYDRQDLEIAGLVIESFDFEGLSQRPHVFQSLARINLNLEDSFRQQEAFANRVLDLLNEDTEPQTDYPETEAP